MRPGLHHLLGALLELARRDVLDVGGDVPDVAEGVLHASRAVAVKLVLEGLHDLGAGLSGALHNLIDVRHIDMQMHCAATAAQGAEEIHLAVFVGQHHARVANAEFRVADFSARPGNTQQLFRAEGFLVEGDRLRGVAAGKIRRHGVISVRNRFYSFHRTCLFHSPAMIEPD
jgi:hypothetical protein